MRQLSFWAKKNPITARFLIFFSHVLLVLNAFFLGWLTYNFDFEIANWALVLAANIFFIAYFFYPIKKQRQGWFKYSYVKQKAIDFILMLTYTLVLAAGLNSFCFSPNSEPDFGQPRAQLIALRVHPEPEGGKSQVSKSGLKTAVKEWRKNIKAELKALKKAKQQKPDKGKKTGLKIFLILLTIALAIALGMLVAALACSIACSGSEAAAIVLLILGWAGIIWLGVITIKNIGKNIGNKQEVEAVPEG